MGYGIPKLPCDGAIMDMIGGRGPCVLVSLEETKYYPLFELGRSLNDVLRHIYPACDRDAPLLQLGKEAAMR